MWPLLVVFLKPGLRDLANLLERVEQIGIENFLSIGLVEALNERVLVRLPRLDEVQLDLLPFTPLGEGDGRQLAAVVEPQQLWASRTSRSVAP